MESNGLGSGIFPTINNGFLGVENPLKQQQQQQNLQNQPNSHTLHHHQMVSYDQPQQSIKQNYSYSSKTNNNKPQQINLSDEDEPSSFGADDLTSGDPKRKGSPWHRMKWTDTMVRLLIMAVYYIGDEAGTTSEGINNNDKKKVTGLLQKKGKWKSVSKGMMEKGYYVSPQQCEDKFNDLNKRYKRVNDILGKGTACRVVENQSLLDTMDLSTKLKDEARKLLNSKHLFFREMCAYHNSCGHGNNNNNTQPQQQQPQQPQQQQPQQQQCLHSSNGVGSLGMLKLKVRNGGGEEEDDEDEEDEWEDDSEEEEDELSIEGGYGSKGLEEDENNDHLRKKSRKVSSLLPSQVMQQLSSEVMNVLQDGVKSCWEKKQWMKKRVVQLAEQQINYQVEGYEIEKQRLKWARFSSNKEREIERNKLENERKSLEIDRMVLLLRQKELELQNTQPQQQQHSST